MYNYNYIIHSGPPKLILKRGTLVKKGYHNWATLLNMLAATFVHCIRLVSFKFTVGQNII